MRVRDVEDARALLRRAVWHGTSAAERRRAAEAVLEWIEARDQEMRDREHGCVALLSEAALLVGQRRRSGR